MADPPGRPGAGPLIEVHRLRVMQAIDVVGAPAYDPNGKFWPRAESWRFEWAKPAYVPLDRGALHSPAAAERHDEVIAPHLRSKHQIAFPGEASTKAQQSLTATRPILRSLGSEDPSRRTWCEEGAFPGFRAARLGAKS